MFLHVSSDVYSCPVSVSICFLSFPCALRVGAVFDSYFCLYGISDHLPSAQTTDTLTPAQIGPLGPLRTL